MCFLFSYSKISKRLEGVSYKVFLINHTECMAPGAPTDVYNGLVFYMGPHGNTALAKGNSD